MCSWGGLGGPFHLRKNTCKFKGNRWDSASEASGSVHTSALRKAWVTGLKAAGWVLQLAAASAGAGPVVFSALSRALRVQSLACPHLPASPMRPSWMQRWPPLLLLVSHIRGAIGWLHLLDRTSCSLVVQIVGG